MTPIEQGLTLLRSSGLRMGLFFQSLAQLKSVFKRTQSELLDNTEQLYFGAQSLETAKRISNMLGNFTETAESYGENRSSSFQYTVGQAHSRTRTDGSNITVSQHSRELLKPEEILNLSGEVLIAFLRGVSRSSPAG